MGKKKKGSKKKGSKKKGSKKGGDAGGVGLDAAALAAKRNELEIQKLKRHAAERTSLARRASSSALEAKEANSALRATLEQHTLSMRDASFNLQREYKALESEAECLRRANAVLEARVDQLTAELARKDALISDLRVAAGPASPSPSPDPPGADAAAGVA